MSCGTRSEGTLFGGDLYLGVKVRIAHPGEDPRAAREDAPPDRRVRPDAAVRCASRLCAEPDAAARWRRPTGRRRRSRAIERRIASGASDAAIVRELFGGESVPGYFSGGDYSQDEFRSGGEAGNGD